MSVMVMASEDFIDVKAIVDKTGTNWTTDENGTKVNWQRVCVLQVRKSVPLTLFYKHQYDEEFKAIRVNRRGRKSQVIDLSSEKFTQLNQGPYGIKDHGAS